MVEKPFILPQPIQPIGRPQAPTKPTRKAEESFSNLLQKEIQQSNKLKFSKHAQARLDARQITLNQNHLNRLDEAVKKAEQKGSRESLVLLDDLAFVVSIKNKTVITAVDGNNRKENVFTNIDSAVIN